MENVNSAIIGKKLKFWSSKKTLAAAVGSLLFSSEKNLTRTEIYSCKGPSPNWSGYKELNTPEKLVDQAIEDEKHVELARIRRLLDCKHGRKEPSENLKLKRLITIILGWEKGFRRDVSIWSYQPDYRTSYFCSSLKRILASFLVEDLGNILKRDGLSLVNPSEKYSDSCAAYVARDFLNYLLGVSIGQQSLFLKLKSSKENDRDKARAVVDYFNHVLENAKKLLLLQDCVWKDVVLTKKAQKNIAEFLDSDFQVQYSPGFLTNPEETDDENQS